MSAVKAEHYAAYTDSGVEWLGEVPKHWSFVRVKEIAYINQKSLSDETPLDYEFDYVDIGSVTYGTSGYSSERMTFENAPSRAKRIVKSGDTIISTVRTYLKAITQIDCAENLIVSTGFAVLTPKKIIYKSYFSNWLMSETFINRVSAISKGVSYPATNSTEIGDLFVFLPPLLEQTSIAAYLDTKTAQIDRQIDLLSQKATQYGKLKQSLINETVTRGLDKAVPMKDSGVICIGLIPRHWKKLRLKDLGTIETSSIDKKTIENEKLVKLVNYSDIYGNLKKEIFNQVGYMIVSANAKQIKDKNLNQGDVLFTPSSETYEDIGVSSVVMENLIDTLYSYHILRLRFHKKIELNFKKYLFNNNYVQTYFSQSAKGTTRKILGLTQFNNLELVFPPAYKEQKEIAAYLDHKTTQIDRIINVIGSQIDKLKDLRKALINDVVTGKIKVVSGGIAV